MHSMYNQRSRPIYQVDPEVEDMLPEPEVKDLQIESDQNTIMPYWTQIQKNQTINYLLQKVNIV